MATRRHAREVVLQMLYQVDLNPDVAAETIRAMINEKMRSRSLRDFAWGLFAGVMECRAALDQKIEANAENWTILRMAPTDRNILRLGGYEMLFADTPPRVAIDEAIELAKRFGSTQSSQFVNGILDRLMPRGGSK